MTNKGKLWLCMSFFAGFWACSDDSENINEEITVEDISNVTAIDEASITFTDAVTISNQVLTNEQVINGRIQQCYVLNHTETENQLLVTFESSCQDFDGKLRSGSFLIDWEGTLGAGNFSYTVTFDGYEVNGYEIAGSITVSGLTLSENGFGFNVVVNDGIVNCPDGRQINYEQDLDYNFIIGEVTEIQITGSSAGMGKEGNSYIANIIEPLLIQSDCEYVVSGSFDATFNGRPQITVNYGDGGCDSIATASRGDLSLTFELD